MGTQNRQHGTPFGTGHNYGSEAQKLSGQRSGFERSTGNDESCMKTAISLIDAEMYQDRPHVGGFSGRRLLFEGYCSLTGVKEP